MMKAPERLADQEGAFPICHKAQVEIYPVKSKASAGIQVCIPNEAFRHLGGHSQAEAIPGFAPSPSGEVAFIEALERTLILSVYLL